MKKLIMCEGSNELEIVEILLKADKFIFSRDDLLTLVPFHARQIKKSTAVQTALRLYHGPIEILRIGDSMTDKLSIPAEYKDRIVSITKYCTKPELEILLILSENLASEFEKTKSTKKAKNFCKEQIIYHGQRYNNSTAFYRNYYGSTPEKLVHAIKSYRQTHGSHKKDEHYLAELLK